MAISYWIIAGVTFSIILNAFLRDEATQKMSLTAWIFIMTATVLWPVTLPFIISSKLRITQKPQQDSGSDRKLDKKSDRKSARNPKAVVMS